MPRRRLISLGILTVVILTGIVLAVQLQHANTAALSPYGAQLQSPVRGLSSQEVDDLLNGRGAGYARMAELNNYPGPRHVLDLEKELGLSSNQIQQIGVVFEQMQAEAKHIGTEVVQREGELSAAFAGKTISEAAMRTQSETLGQMYGALRATHLRAHLSITPLLSAEQITKYNMLRGYVNTPAAITPGEHQHQSD